ncbi:hypothetical protein RND71_023064 [Anisodus tanguticus]|uniref:Uncharacterized protein n=1 Tax=Anisodus tanguticus TaxID=243964 RepID=A0AAE1RUG3_9SOLA|nr:hypothetical protein RND71_023064 [Anisodus tanguticus]
MRLQKQFWMSFEGFTTITFTLHGVRETRLAIFHECKQLKAYWQAPEFIAKSEQTKVPPASQNGGSLHNTGARNQGHVARKMVGYKEVIHEYKKNHLEGELAQPPSEFEIEIWCIVDVSQNGRTYGLGPRNNFQRLQSGQRGERTSQQGEDVDGVHVTAMAQQIAELNR